MAGTRTTVLGIDLSASAREWLAPVDSGLLYANFFGSEAMVDRNLATGGAIKRVGSPIYQKGYTLFDKNSFLNTGIFDQPAFTLMANFALQTGVPANTNQWAISSYAYSSKGKIGSGISTPDPTAMKGLMGYTGGGAEALAQAVAAAPPSVNSTYLGLTLLWVFRSDGSNLKLDCITTGQNIPSVALPGPRSLSNLPYLIGASADDGGVIGISSTAIFGRSISDAEMAAMAVPMRAYSQAAGIGG